MDLNVDLYLQVSYCTNLLLNVEMIYFAGNCEGGAPVCEAQDAASWGTEN